ncbi:hypothetical protein WPG_3353 [Winogradskyella sp. PG-2]|nr:hypothetical protein WPG_3353 [Winogradskyella sp. PG-2]
MIILNLDFVTNNVKTFLQFYVTIIIFVNWYNGTSSKKTPITKK